MRKHVHVGEEKRGSEYGAGARKRSCGMQRARSDERPTSNSIQHRQKVIEDQRFSMTFSFAQQKLWRFAQRVKNARQGLF